MAALELGQEQLLGLSEAQQENLRNVWNRKNQDPKAFVPHELHRRISKEKAIEENQAFGLFASGYLKRALVCDQSQVSRRRQRNKKIVAVGYGRGYDASGDAKWLREATQYGLSTHWIDISSQACLSAINRLNAEYEEMQWEGHFVGGPHPKVDIGEIYTILSRPESIKPKLDLELVEVWYLSRVLGFLKKDSVNFVLEKLGESLGPGCDEEKEHKVIIIAAFSDDNPHRTGYSSTMYELGKVLKGLALGAERSVVATAIESYRYFDKEIKAITFRAE
jgi:hypothetical protein